MESSVVRARHGAQPPRQGTVLSPQLSKVGIRTVHSALCSSKRSFIIDTQIHLDRLPSSRAVQSTQPPSAVYDGSPFGSSVPTYLTSWAACGKCPIPSCQAHYKRHPTLFYEDHLWKGSLISSVCYIVRDTPRQTPFWVPHKDYLSPSPVSPTIPH